jgi:ubiquitin carboxyl-terminal hydrolase 9/24
MQQLYTTPHFAESILSIEPPEKENKQKEDTLDSDLQMFEELKIIMANLHESRLKAFTPTKFCESFRDFEGNSIDVYVQQDAQEFFGSLCDKLHTVLNPTKNKMLLDKFFRGFQVNQIKSKECEHTSSREEPFFTYGVEVSRKNNLVDALEDSMKGEMLAGENKYKCEKCNTYVDALKRSTIKVLPNTLIIQLKRFDFNFETMQKDKLNCYFEFPDDLDMKKFTEEGINFAEGNTNVFFQDDSYYQYKLKGVVIHRGSTADSGHYYSFIKEPICGKWLEFNDEVVRSFDHGVKKKKKKIF